MNPLRPAGMILAIALLAGVALVSVVVVAMQSNDDDADANGIPTEEAVEEAVGESGSTPDAEPTEQIDEENAGDQAPVATPPDANPDENGDDSDEPAPVDEPTPEPVLLSDEELQEYQPNELGQIMVLMYHQLIEGDTAWHRTPEQFRQDLQWLYDNDFYVIPIRDYIRNEINAPAGKRPVVLTFDDGTISQFNYIEQPDGSVAIDPDSAIGILEEFFTRYDDFGRGGLFSILPNAPFAWPDADDQMQYAEDKLRWLYENGYELGNHTVGHVNLRDISDEEIKSELARAIDMIQGYVPEAEVSVLAVPFGVYPQGGDTSIFEGFEYEGRHYSLEGALMVGAEPAPSPVHENFDPMWIPRINADDDELGKWFSFVEENPGIMYVSDGNPDTITFPEDLHPWLVDTFDESKAEGKTVVRY